MGVPSVSSTSPAAGLLQPGSGWAHGLASCRVLSWSGWRRVVVPSPSGRSASGSCSRWMGSRDLSALLLQGHVFITHV